MNPLLAAPTETPLAPPAYGTEQELGTWAGEAQRPAAQAAAADQLTDLPVPTKLLQEHLGLPRQPGHATVQKPLRPAQGAAKSEPDSSDARDAKDAIRPVRDELAKSGLVEAARNLKAELGLKSDRQGASIEAANSLESAGADGGAAKAEQMVNAGSRAEFDNRYRSADQIKGERLLAQAMMDQLIDDAKPWALGLLGLYVLGYFLKLGLDYHHWKVTRGDKRLRTHQPVKGDAWVAPRPHKHRRSH